MKKILDFIQEKNNADTLFVLKGFDLNLIGLDNAEISKTIENKFMRALYIYQDTISVISFDEFICLFNMLTDQFKKIYILENPIYNHIFPIGVNISPDGLSRLLLHFDTENDETNTENTVLSGIEEYINIYNNFICINDVYSCSFNLDSNLLKNGKIQSVSFHYEIENIISDDKSNINLYNEYDYFNLITKLYSSHGIFSISYEGFLTGKDSIENKIFALIETFKNRIVIDQDRSTDIQTECPTEIIELMQNYWGYNSFREINIYNLEALKENNKKVQSIPQSQIIADLVNQVENCVQNKNFRDIFVTAPTGSGKSLMFQLPAMYIAEKYNLLTLVITPLIGLMNDQVDILKNKGYTYARTINSDISPIIKSEILEDVANGKCHILYLSPESLLSRSDIQQLIGERKIGMIVVDESHIVTTWGKQFRPDYWYLGDHVQKIRRKQSNREDNPSPFIIATFTATAIYEGNEDMYHETLNSLHMIDPITYLGYVKRDDIQIGIKQVEEKKNKSEYEINKFDGLISMIKVALMRSKKVLIYFPTVALINRFHDYCYSKGQGEFVVKYHGQLTADSKNEGFEQFKNGKKPVMLATKAFGMGIDIPDISIVSHFAPTGNVCDYMQEIGRAARDTQISGEAVYNHMSNDFKHINRLHGLSAIQKYQLVEVIKKVLDIYLSMRYKDKGQVFTKKRNEMLIDTESFGYIFESPMGDDADNLMNKVKTAMLLIQKDYENRGFAPFYIKPIPMFAFGYFSISPKNQKILNDKFTGTIKLIHHPQNICEVNLKDIWQKRYSGIMSFPKFKFLLYTKQDEVAEINKLIKSNAMCVDLDFEEHEAELFTIMFNSIKAIAHKSITQGKYFSSAEIIDEFASNTSISKYRSENIVNVLISSINIYKNEYATRLNVPLYKGKPLKNGSISYSFNPAIREFFNWLNLGYQNIKSTVSNNKLYIENDLKGTRCKEITTILGILESFGMLRFKMLGGSNSQIYIYVNETKTMQMVKDRPNSYRNRLLETINNRHLESVKMLKFLFQNNFSSEEIWDHLENYFIGILPNELKSENEKSTIIDDEDEIFQVQVGDEIKNNYIDWNEINMMFDNEQLSSFDSYLIPLADYHSCTFIYGELTASADLLWFDKKIALVSECSKEMHATLNKNGWKCLNLDEFTIHAFKSFFEEE